MDRGAWRAERSMGSMTLWGRKESDTTERLSTHTMTIRNSEHTGKIAKNNNGFYLGSTLLSGYSEPKCITTLSCINPFSLLE